MLTFLRAIAASVWLLIFASMAAAQPGAAYVARDKVDAALAKGGTLVDRPQVRVAGVHRDRPGALETQKGTTILYVTDGEGVFAAGAQSQPLVKGDLLVIPAGTAQAFTRVSHTISCLMIIVPVIATEAKGELVFVARETVAATMKKAAPLADGPNLRVSGGYRPFAAADASPVSELHDHEADLFYIVSGRATQMLGGEIVDGKQTGPGQIRGSKTAGGQTYQIGDGDVMWVPAGMPHWFPQISAPMSYLLVKVFY